MKKIFLTIVGACLLVFGGVGVARAVPIYYTLQGIVTNIINQTTSQYQIERRYIRVYLYGRN